MGACNRLGKAYRDSNGVARDIYKAAQLFQKACDGGNMGGCVNLGDAYYNGNGVTKDFNKAAQLYQKACDGGNMRGCNVLKKFYILL